MVGRPCTAAVCVLSSRRWLLEGDSNACMYVLLCMYIRTVCWELLQLAGAAVWPSAAQQFLLIRIHRASEAACVCCQVSCQ